MLILIWSPVHLCTCVASMQGIGWWFDQWINIAIHSPHPPFWSVLFPFCRNDCYSIPFRVVSVLFAYDWCADRRINLPPTWWDHIIWIGCWYGHLVVIRIIYYHLAVNITKSMLPRHGKQKLKRWISIKNCIYRQEVLGPSQPVWVPPFTNKVESKFFKGLVSIRNIFGRRL